MLRGSTLSSHQQGVAQIVYLLDMATRSYAHITTTYEEACLSDPCQDLGILSFSLDCQHVLVAWQLAGTECGCRFDAHSLTGRVMCRFTLEELEDGATAPAHAQGNRNAVAFCGMFGVWDGTSGLLLGRRRPGYEDPDDVDQDDARLHHNLIAANKSGTRLAFCKTWAPALWLYDAVSLELLRCLAPGPALRPALVANRLVGLACGVYGWTLMQGRGSDMCLYICRPGAGHTRYTPTVWCQDQPMQLPAFSPDGAFVAVVCGAGVQVHDARTGQHLLTQAILPPPAGADVCHVTDILVSWSSCGQRILVRMVFTRCFVRRDRYNQNTCSEHLLVVQL